MASVHLPDFARSERLSQSRSQLILRSKVPGCPVPPTGPPLSLTAEIADQGAARLGLDRVREIQGDDRAAVSAVAGRSGAAMRGRDGGDDGQAQP
jgi:hypothetical protein